MTILGSYLSSYDDPPPIAEILDLIFDKVSWQDPETISRLIRTEADTGSIAKSGYVELFDRIHKELTALARSRLNGDEDLTKARFTIGYPFSDATQIKEIKLPRGAIDWIKRRSATPLAAFERETLTNSVIVTAALGALGSLVFLVRDLVSSRNDVSLISFGLRPLFGVFIAIVFFVLLIVAHSLISSSRQAEIRYSTMYFLALAAGLLSDQAYRVLERRLTKNPVLEKT